MWRKLVRQDSIVNYVDKQKSNKKAEEENHQNCKENNPNRQPMGLTSKQSHLIKPSIEDNIVATHYKIRRCTEKIINEF